MWESPRLSFFVIEVFGTNAQPASGRCRLKGVWAQPNKHFEFGFEKSDSKIASWYQLALLASFVWALSLREVSTLKVRSCQARREMLPLT